MFCVISKNGLFFPQKRRGNGWHPFYGSCQQFGAYRGDKSFKTEKGAIAFVKRCSEDVQSA